MGLYAVSSSHVVQSGFLSSGVGVVNGEIKVF